MEAMKRDKFALNFNQFYQLLLRITEIVYPDLYPVDEPYAFNKFLAVSSFSSIVSQQAVVSVPLLFTPLFHNRRLSCHCLYGVTDIARKVRKVFVCYMFMKREV